MLKQNTAITARRCSTAITLVLRRPNTQPALLKLRLGITRSGIFQLVILGMRVSRLPSQVFVTPGWASSRCGNVQLKDRHSF